MTMPSAERTILLVFTGGTISMVLDPESGAARPALSGSDILARIHEDLSALGKIEIDEFGKHPGPHMTPERMLDVARHVETGLQRTGAVGAVVTHGTDSLEETAYLLDLVLPAGRPVVFTGAMKTSSEENWDGPANLTDACRVASHPDAVGRGVMVVLDATIHAAQEATKTDTEAFGAFRSPRSGPVGQIDRGEVRFFARPERPAPTPVDRLEERVDLIPAAAGADDRLLRASLEGGAKGIVLQAMGRGNIPPAMLPGVRAALDACIPVVVTSRCGTGRVGPRYGYDGGGAMLREMGCILGGDLPAWKARIRLMVLLGSGAEPDAVLASFRRG